MKLSALPDLRAAQAPDAPAVADDNVDLNNIQFSMPFGGPARRCASTAWPPATWWRSCCPTKPASSWRCSRHGGWVGGHPDQPDTGAAEVSYQLEDAAPQVLVVGSRWSSTHRCAQW